eukprot:gnl/TRDRNA2_/TRDRNA2_63049_c0_seq1.p1 gnl/TRDRNA2_/TRDRNA2_63049_c0~~gnl/TRDRNA2_/TRDRNA2_63049_c0_seq1.p1  ORF type:complete len:462 (+),score=95.46 gnl/TRDRNA2_/TRDRNA2_63049_c0_seq1:84-1469(+)
MPFEEAILRHRTDGNMPLRDYNREIFRSLSGNASTRSPPRSVSSRASSASVKSLQKDVKVIDVTPGAKLRRFLHKGGAAVVALLVFLLGLLFGSRSGTDGAATVFEQYDQKLQSVTSRVAKLQGLSQVVMKADETYADVYQEQLVLHDRDATSPEESDWNSFVSEAKVTGPVFLDGKERLRDAVGGMHRLIRRAPEFLFSVVKMLKAEDVEEAGWYLKKMVTLVDSVHGSMEAAASKFAEVDAAVNGMKVDAKENEEHLESKAFRLEGEAAALEAAEPARSGSWTHRKEAALYYCQLEKMRVPLLDCKQKCIGHGTNSCTQLTYYKSASMNNCYLHCGTASIHGYSQADTYVLERAPDEVAMDIAEKRDGSLAAVKIRSRWRSVQGSLQNVTQLAVRFRSATADLRKGLEEVRFASDDLRMAFSAPLVDRQRFLELMERRVSDVAAAISDLGESLAWLREE